MSSAERRYEILLAEEAERARARHVFAAGMVGGLVLTVAGNLAAPLVTTSVPLALVAFSLPPILAGWGAHMALTVHRAAPRTVAGKRAAYAAIGLSALLFVIALVASYSHLRAVFITATYADWLASIFALAIDAVLLGATVAWFAMRPASDAELRAARAEMEAEDEARRKAEADAERARLDAERVEREAREAELERARLAHEAELERARIEARERAREDAQRVIGRSRPSALEPDIDHRFAAQAEAAHRAGIARRTPIAKVAAALELLSIGETNGGVERGCGVHRDTVQKLRDWLDTDAESAA